MYVALRAYLVIRGYCLAGHFAPGVIGPRSVDAVLAVGSVKYSNQSDRPEEQADQKLKNAKGVISSEELRYS
jgi:hypothetical protein